MRKEDIVSIEKLQIIEGNTCNGLPFIKFGIKLRNGLYIETDYLVTDNFIDLILNKINERMAQEEVK